MKNRISDTVALAILKDLSSGLAVFDPSSRTMLWCNPVFKKQTWFGGAPGGKNAQSVSLLDLFDARDHAAVQELLRIAVEAGQAYDFQRPVRRGPHGSFPAELKLRKQKMQGDDTEYVCLEITDLSLNKLYDELQSAHAAIRGRLADLMAAQAELHYTVRMSTISELGADLAHQLINPVTICRDLIESRLLPRLATSGHRGGMNPRGAERGGVSDGGDRGDERDNGGDDDGDGGEAADVRNVLGHLKGIQDLAVWFRRFSNPKLSESQVCRLQSIVEDALILNMYRFSKQAIGNRIVRKSDFEPSAFAVPISLIMWVNAAFCEIANLAPAHGSEIEIVLDGDDHNVTMEIRSRFASPRERDSYALPATLEGLARRTQGSSWFRFSDDGRAVSFYLVLTRFHESVGDEPAPLSGASEPEPTPDSRFGTGPRAIAARGEETETRAEFDLEEITASRAVLQKPLVLIVDDEPDIRRLLMRALKASGLDAIEASDGHEALQIFTTDNIKELSRRIRVIVSDVRMPNMTGPHLLLALRDAGIGTPFIFFSSNIVEADARDRIKDQDVYYLTKDSGIDELKKLVRTCSGIDPESAPKGQPDATRKAS